jgi:VanZ family protein
MRGGRRYVTSFTVTAHGMGTLCGVSRRTRMDVNRRAARDGVRGRARPVAGAALGVALALGAGPLAAQSADRWSGADKALHVGMSAPFGAIGASLAPADAGTGTRLLWGAALGSLPGLAKEAIDLQRQGGTASARDLAANLAGAALGALFADCCLIRPIARGDRLDGVGVEFRVPF